MTGTRTHGLSLETLESRLNLSTLTPASQPVDGALGMLSATRRYRLASVSTPGQTIVATTTASNKAAQVFFEAAKAQQASTNAPAALSPTTPTTPTTALGSVTIGPPAGAHVTQGAFMALDCCAPASNLTNQTGMIGVDVNGITDAQIAALAAQSRTKPAGSSALLISGLDAILTDPQCCCRTATGALTSYLSPWFDPGIADAKALSTNFFSKFYADGGRADYVLDDFEGNISYWAINKAHIQAIAADPRSAVYTQALGPNIFNDLITGGKMSAIYAWNDAMQTDLCNALNNSEFSVAAQYFPGARMSNFDFIAVDASNAIPDGMGTGQYTASYAGNRQGPRLYGQINNLSWAVFPGTQKPYGSSAFGSLRLTINWMRAVAESSPAAIDPWIPGAGLASNPASGTPYFQESVFHEALDGAETFMNWNPYATASQNTLIDQTLATLNQKLGTGPRWSVTPAQMAWNSPLVVSGMQTATSVVWRVSAPPGTKKIKVVETGEILNLNGAAGVWYSSQPGQAIDFTVLS